DLPDPGLMETRQYDMAVELRWECNGGLKVVLSGVANGVYTLDPGPPPADIWYYSARAGGSLSPDVESSVTVGGAQEYEQCWRGPGDLPQPGDGSRAGDNTSGDNMSWQMLGVAAIALLALGIALGKR
ncbi:MAG: hypothetical protein GSR78_01610, partial [Desulfurococcales archaeon]|nr:hypothetical protein [Desulfurococcales archaeon]